MKEIKIYFDAAPNAWEKVINKFGKKIKGTNGFKIGIVDNEGNELDQGHNTRIEWQIEGEAWAALKTINYLMDNNIKKATLLGDNEPVMNSLINKKPMKSKTMAGKYIWIAQKIIKENNLDITWKQVSGDENKADYVSREISNLT